MIGPFNTQMKQYTEIVAAHTQIVTNEYTFVIKSSWLELGIT